MLLVSRQLSVVSGNEQRGARSEICSTLHTPHSALRLGLSLTEVLIAMGILTLGLLGVASVFPVGSYYMQRAEISDKGSAIAQSVMSDLMARGMLNPKSWYVMVPPNGSDAYNQTFPSDGAFADATIRASMRLRFIRPLGATLNEALSQPAAVKDVTTIARQFGSAF